MLIGVGVIHSAPASIGTVEQIAERTPVIRAHPKAMPSFFTTKTMIAGYQHLGAI
jgi:hypothetical protein